VVEQRASNCLAACHDLQLYHYSKQTTFQTNKEMNILLQ